MVGKIVHYFENCFFLAGAIYEEDHIMISGAIFGTYLGHNKKGQLVFCT